MMVTIMNPEPKRRGRPPKAEKIAAEAGFSGDDLKYVNDIFNRNKVDGKYMASREIDKKLIASSQEILNRMIDLAKKGDFKAMEYCLSKIDNTTQGLRIAIDFPELNTKENIEVASKMVMDRLCNGTITTSQCDDLLNVLQTRLKILEATVFVSRLEDLEAETKLVSNK